MLLQLSVLVYFGAATYHPFLSFPKDGQSVDDYAFPCAAAGMFLLAAGMFACGHVVESSTSETRYRPAAGWSARVVWLHRRGTVNDQAFESFAVFPPEAHAQITTSHRVKRWKLRELFSKEAEESEVSQPTISQKKAAWNLFMERDVSEVIAVSGTLITLCGFVLQFIGLRGMHWSASVTQLGANEDQNLGNRQPIDGRIVSSILAAISYSSLSTLFAQHMLSSFMWAAAKKMDRPMDDKAEVRPTKSEGTNSVSALKSFALHNAKLSKLCQGIQATGLGSLDEVYLCIIPPLSRMNKLPSADTIIEWTRKHAEPRYRLGHWKEVADAYLWLFQTAKMFPERNDISTEAIAIPMEFLRALTEGINSREAQRSEEKQISMMKLVRSSVENELSDGDYADILARLMGLYQQQGRRWKCSIVKTPKPLKCAWDRSPNPFGMETKLLRFTKLHWLAYYNKAWHEDRESLTLNRDGIWVKEVQPAEIRKELETDPGRVDERDIFDWTPLHYAAAEAARSSIDGVLAYRANVDAQDIRGRTPLHYCVSRHEYSDVVQLLLREGAAIDIQDMEGRAPIHYAAMMGRYRPLHSLIEAGADVNLVDSLGFTPLFWATYGGHLESVNALRTDSNPRLRDHNGRTPLHLAAMAAEADTQRISDILTVLLGMDIDIEAKDRSGEMPLHLATQAGRLEVVSLLLDKGADIEALDSTYYRNPLQMAASSGDQRMAKLLLERGADVNGGSVGVTALKLAVEYGCLETARLLLENGADVKISDGDYGYAIDVARKSGNEEMVKLIESYS